ncbi:hypothetical protein [Myceligenerans pegani]|uniref:ABC transporter permease n=1 Tax=Myceligenerans pegani TaxID=2776917 RepID=A0ABR9N435_9MICO|nr:hypothetical protein [Myceligenerans sp. TRM 65318]MBE1878433.1 hypothetical protein [Myceligenerans sp. TRM 65318]MBE3020704.1 hypothetical protein [Myceligenerans sp. TRM 65318]
MRAAVATEWIKLRTLRSTWWFLGGAATLMLLLALLESDNGDPTSVQALAPAMSGVSYFVQYVLAGFGMVAITGEFASRSITVTLACTPSRTRVLASKALVVGVTAYVTGVLASAGSLLVAAARFDEFGQLGRAEAGAVLRMGAFLALLAVFCLGLGTLVRRTAGALSITLVLLLLVPELLRLASEKTGLAWLDTVGTWTPSPIGWRFVQGDLADGWALCAWAATAVAAGVWVLRARDV